MRSQPRKPIGARLAALVVSASLVAACAPARIEAARVLSVHPPGRTAPRHPNQHRRLAQLSPKERDALEAWFRALALAAYFHALWHAVYDIPADLAPVAQCIKDHESGNYAESSHPSSGSGAYQYVPGTWRTWFGRWRAAVPYAGPDFAYAYQAPPEVQDAVLVFTLRHGGAGNWSNAYGFDPCTAGM